MLLLAMILYPADKIVSGGSRAGVAPACLLDVQTVDNLFYYWSDRSLAGIPGVLTPLNLGEAVTYQPWLTQAPSFTFYRSLQTDTGSFTIQNVSGDTLGPEFARVTRRGALEGALFVFRYFQVGSMLPWLEVHGTLSVKSVDKAADVAELVGAQLFPAQDDTPAMTFSETCQLVWGEKRCGATGATECLYSYKTCQVTERFTGILNSFEKNFDETLAPVLTQTVNRRRGL